MHDYNLHTRTLHISYTIKSNIHFASSWISSSAETRKWGWKIWFRIKMEQEVECLIFLSQPTNISLHRLRKEILWKEQHTHVGMIIRKFLAPTRWGSCPKLQKWVLGKFCWKSKVGKYLLCARNMICSYFCRLFASLIIHSSQPVAHNLPVGLDSATKTQMYVWTVVEKFFNHVRRHSNRDLSCLSMKVGEWVNVDA